MKKISQITPHSVGTKAYNLHLIQKDGLRVPTFSVFSFDLFQSEEVQDFFTKQQEQYDNGEYSLDEFSQVLQEMVIDFFSREDFQVIDTFQSEQIGKEFSVRSSANVEDAAAASFAGQFTTKLFVPVSDLVAAIQASLLSLYQPSALSYYFDHQLTVGEVQLYVIVQEMIQGELSGVYFTANPQGLLNEHLIVVGEGVGSGIVEDRVATTMVTIHPEEQLSYFETTDQSPIITNEQQHLLTQMATQIMTLFGPYMDIEFTFRENELYVLQARPITKMSPEPSVILDNSNIVESYPVTTTPLTFSFIQEAYSSIFRGLAKRLLKNDEKTLAAFEPTFQQMIAQSNSRVYYQINNWYKLLQLLPFSKKVIPIWQEMLGVQTPQITDSVQISKFTHLKIMGRMMKSFVQAPSEMQQLEREFDQIFAYFNQNYHANASFDELYELFEQIKDQILAKWDVTLVNDLYAFIYTGILKKVHSTEAVQAEIAGIEQIESMKPVIELNKIIASIQKIENQDYRSLIQQLKSTDVQEFLVTNEHSLTKSIQQFILLFGDRAPEELKLETPTFRSQPQRLIQLIQQQLTLPIGTTVVEKPTTTHRTNFVLRWMRKRALLGIKYRESSRLNRTRIYGMMRLIFVTMGERLVEQKCLQQLDDVFYLTMSELFTLSKTQQAMQAEINQRKQKHLVDRQLPAFSRFVFTNQPFEKYPQNINQESVGNMTAQLQGIGCSQGIVRGQIIVVEDVQQMDVQQTYGKIIVTKMTDPGWVYLLTQAKGIIAEKGSLLSHTAIISRELGIPAVVNVQQATRQFKTNDWVEIDGQTGRIRRLKGENDKSELDDYSSKTK
ncbi:phosphoenolpyruvate synthase [Candidatus Enterococcus willemsii]|uniref:Phosphoenolpyruvate synthase n=1 Tax=Candidatus Enterococcus willemsii TaxID=1857215 RepID=A0ABQ6YVW3_9ENTE|nr:phosphoenolpyruvate synthase [Enterococcus sp. CU12B]KAF1301466.1 phosphoenolpyruvate synthase [Enterococcus sp. CU12B]